ncbi:MAG: cell envelope integrity protein CreD [Boseongicola sp.]|nr:MAG: cell envelope integrity protein CreD [Boseongicola sp.]
MFQSPGLRFIAVGILTLLMFIPLNMVSSVINDRANYSGQTINDLSHEWGGAQRLSGPQIIVPVTEDVTYDRRREAVDALTGLTLRDDKGNPIFEHYQETITEARPPVYLYPEDLDIQLTSRSQTRSRGIFNVPVYTTDALLNFTFNTDLIEPSSTAEEVIHWDETRLNIYLSSNRALRGEAQLTSAGRPLTLEPISQSAKKQTGITTLLGDPRETGPFVLSLTMNGAQHLAATATGRTTTVSINSDWPDPSFFGNFLPDAREITENGFTAEWIVPHLARSLPQVARENFDPTARKSASMGVRFITPNDFYQKAYRSARYGILFIALTFLTILLLDRAGKKPAHPVQYLMVGLAQSVFVLLMVAYAEQIGFGAAYLLAAGATIGLLTIFGATALKLGRRAMVLAAMLITVYAVLYLILRSADFALLAGSTLAFVALAGTMILTRNEDWHGPQREPRQWFRRKTPPPAPTT